MKRLFIIIISLSLNVMTAQNNSRQLNQEQTMLVVQKMMQYFDQYENGAPESLKIAKFNEYVDEVAPEMSAEDRKKSYKVVDAYIRGSKGEKIDIQLSAEQEQELRSMLQEAEQKKQAGMQAMLNKVQEMRNMSYAEFKNYVTQNGNILLDEAEIQKAYNQLHKDDGKQVKVIPSGTNKKIDNPMTALDIVQHPKGHSYQEFAAAMKFLSPDIPEEDIKKIWNEKKKK